MTLTACYPVQRPYSLALPQDTGLESARLREAMSSVGMTPARNQCDAGVLYTKWEDTGRQEQPLSYDGDSSTEVFRRLALRIRRTSAGSTLTLSVEALRCELSLVALVGTSPERGRASCSPDRIPGAGVCMTYDSSRLDPRDQTELDQRGRRLELALSSR
jgi:hypothetical protein